MTDTRMPSAELQSVREYLGLTNDALARMLSVNPRTLRSWESGREPIPRRVREEVEAIEHFTSQAVDAIVDDLEDSHDSIIAVVRTDDEFALERPEEAARGFTARWWRHVCARVARKVPGLIIVAADEFEAIVDEAVEAELRDQLRNE